MVYFSPFFVQETGSWLQHATITNLIDCSFCGGIFMWPEVLWVRLQYIPLKPVKSI